MTDENPRGPWPHRLAWLLACATFSLILVGSTVTNYGAGMAVEDWPTTFGYWFYPLKAWLAVWDVFLEHGRRMLAQAVGLLTIILAAVLWRRDSRRWVWLLGLAAV
ncbi:MAG: cytochrome oxidase assembly protein, partial [Thermoguttaceae bacterium]